MSRILIVYGTAYGQTERIAQRIAGVLNGSGHTAEAVKGDRLPGQLSLGDYDAFIVAASVRYGRHQRYIRAFVREHIVRLNAAPSAFVSVCGAMTEASSEGPDVAQAYIERFLRETGWRPWAAQSFAGGLPYRRYGLFVRLMMKMISRRTGRPTDTSRDYDFTNWAMVDQFAGNLATVLRFPAHEPATTPPASLKSKPPREYADRDQRPLNRSL